MKHYQSLATLANENACFDLQFRKDMRKERLNAPTYYRWKVQFIITGPKENLKVMKQIQKELQCGNIHVVKNQSRFSVQNLDEINNAVIPFFRKNTLSGNKKKDFELWRKAADIIYKNKGVYISKWEKQDLTSLMHIHTSIAKYKSAHRQPKWIEMAQLLTTNAGQRKPPLK